MTSGTRVGDTNDKSIADVHECVGSGHESRARRWESVHGCGTQRWPGRSWMSFNCCKNCREDDRDKCEERRGSSQLRKRLESARERAKPTDHCCDRAEAHGTDASTSHGVQVLCASQDVESLDEGVVEEEHDCCEPPRQ